MDERESAIMMTASTSAFFVLHARSTGPKDNRSQAKKSTKYDDEDDRVGNANDARVHEFE